MPLFGGRMKPGANLLLFLMGAVGIAFAREQPISPPKVIPVNIPGYSLTGVSAINGAGVMVGSVSTPGGHCFVAVGTKVTILDVPGADETACTGINSAGAIVGFFFRAGIQLGFLFQNHRFTEVGPRSGSDAFGINDAGEIVGVFGDANGTHGFLWDGTSYQTLDVPGAKLTAAQGINNQGQITLLGRDSNDVDHSWLYDGANYTNIDVPGAANTDVYGINNLGDVVYTWEDSLNVNHAAVLHDGKYHTFQAPGASRTEAFGINDQDVIVGIMWQKDGSVYSGFKLIP
jgi:probable HAF family extracellular repeat protein